MDDTGTYWVLTSPFDDATDEYSERYSIFDAGQDQAHARTTLYQHCSAELAEPICTLPVASFEFDTTKRASFRITQPIPGSN